MQDLDIFESGRPQSGKFFYHKEVGDAIQGTYIDVREGRDGYGNEQFIYVLKDKEGQIWNVGVRKGNTFLNEKMKNVKLGQIVGLRFDEERPSTKSPTGKTKIIRVYEDPAVVDKEWLDQRERLSALYGTPVVAPSAPAPAAVQPVAAAIPTDKAAATPVAAPVAAAPQSTDGSQAVRNLAITKGLAEETMSQEQVDAAIVAYTGLPITEANLAPIVIKLAEYKRA